MSTMDMFETRTMLEALEQVNEPNEFLLDMFFAGEETHLTDNVDIDVIKAGRKMASFVSPMAEAAVVEREGFTAMTFKPPYLKEKKPFSGADLLKRQPGETIFSGQQTPAQKAQAALGQDLVDLTRRFRRRESWMAFQALIASEIVCRGEGVNAKVTFPRNTDHTIVLGADDKWTADTSKPLSQLRDWKLMVLKNSGWNPTVAVVGTDVAKAVMENASIQAALDLRRLERGEIKPQDLDQNVQYLGTLEGVEFYTFADWYQLDNGTLVPMLPADGIILGNPRARCTRHYGLIKDIRCDAVVKRFPKSWEEDDPSVRWVSLQSAPLPVPHECDAFAYIDAL